VPRSVIDYDHAHGGDLLPTIRTWLEHDRQTDKAAQALHIHPNTLLYRVRRFEQITGRSLASTEALAGAVVTFVAYLLLTRNLDVKGEQAAIDRSDAELRAMSATDD
jgi:DNA-binding PucR family transcriptional regulator